MKQVGSGTLFQDRARSTFMRITMQRMNSMVTRAEKKDLPPIPFTVDQFRTHFLRALGNHYDGIIQCRYCRGFFTLEQIAIDHEVPLSRGGSSDLDNLGYPCADCNQAKGQMSPYEFLELLDFLDRKIPMAKTDVLARLKKAIALAAGAWRNAAIISDLKETGAWQQAQAARNQINKSKRGR